MRTREKKVFISHSSEDEIYIYPVVQIIRFMRPDLVFYDKLDLIPSKKWESRLWSALKSADTVILFWCHHSAKSSYVRKEYQYALDSNKDILPLLFDNTPLETALADYQWIDFRKLNYHELPAPLESKVTGAPSSYEFSFSDLFLILKLLGASILGFIIIRDLSSLPLQILTAIITIYSLIAILTWPSLFVKRMVALPGPSREDVYETEEDKIKVKNWAKSIAHQIIEELNRKIPEK